MSNELGPMDNHPHRLTQPMDDAPYRRIDLMVMLDIAQWTAKIQATAYRDRGQLVSGRVVLTGIGLDGALSTAIDLLRENFPKLGQEQLPFGPEPI